MINPHVVPSINPSNQSLGSHSLCQRLNTMTAQPFTIRSTSTLLHLQLPTPTNSFKQSGQRQLGAHPRTRPMR